LWLSPHDSLSLISLLALCILRIRSLSGIIIAFVVLVVPISAPPLRGMMISGREKNRREDVGTSHLSDCTEVISSCISFLFYRNQKNHTSDKEKTQSSDIIIFSD
jgi:hypothetical protein